MILIRLCSVGYIVREQRDERGNALHLSWATVSDYRQGIFYMHHCTDRTAHTTTLGHRFWSTGLNNNLSIRIDLTNYHTTRGRSTTEPRYAPEVGTWRIWHQLQSLYLFVSCLFTYRYTCHVFQINELSASSIAISSQQSVYYLTRGHVLDTF